MGVVARQGILNSIFIYAGIVLGYLNLMLLFTNFMTPEQLGLTRVLLALSMLGYQFSALGLVQTILRYFPFFKNKENGHNGFLFNVVLVSLVGSALVFSLMYIFQENIENIYSDKSPLFSDNFNFLYPLSGFILLFFVFDTYARSLLKTVVSEFLIEIFQKLITTVLLFAYYFQQIDFNTFLVWWVLSYAIIDGILIGYLVWLKEFNLKPNFSFLDKKKVKEISSYSLMSLMSHASQMIVARIDIILIGYLLGLEKAGIYSIAYLIANAIGVPGKAIGRIAAPLVAQAWKENDRKKINSLYHKTALNQFIASGFIFLGISLNLDSIFQVMQKEYATGFWVVIFMGLGKLVDMATGINGRILATSIYYRFDLFFNLLLVAVVIITDLILIPQFGIAGAAFASLIAIVFFNFSRIGFLYSKYKMNPFNGQFLKVLVLGGITFAAVYFIPVLENFILDTIVRSLIISIVFLSGVYFLKISEDINAFIRKHVKKYTGKELPL